MGYISYFNNKIGSGDNGDFINDEYISKVASIKIKSSKLT